MSDGPSIPLDAIVIGGGVAGLWTLHTLRRSGRSAVLIEHRALGTGQTIWSQGIIHGGIKYALSGAATDAARAIARMPEVWHACLTGAGEVNLAGVKPLSRSQVLWTTPGVISRVAGAVASRAIRTGVRTLGRAEHPTAFAGAPAGIDVYEVDEPVLPLAPVLAALADANAGSICGVAAVTRIDQHAALGDAEVVRVDATRADGTPVRLDAGCVVLAAGEGNEALARLAGFPNAETIMQRRPLHMVMARGPLPEVFGHCLSASTTPRLTITTVAARDGERTWLIGGAIAEMGVPRDEAAQVRAAAAELRACLPWVDFGSVRLATGRINRAEGRTPGGARPDGPVIAQHGRVLAAWPTKLALAPVLAERVRERVQSLGRNPRTTQGSSPVWPCGEAGGIAGLPVPGVAAPPWDERALSWHPC